MNKIIALVNLHNKEDVGLLSQSRATASTTVLGRYAFIDFAISNLTNSGIEKIGVLIKNNARSIIKHFGSENTHLKNPKTGFQSLFINERGIINEDFNTDVNNIKANDWIFYSNEFKYAIVCGVNNLMKINYEDVMDEHIKSGRDISCVYVNVNNGDDKSLYGSDELVIDNLGDVQKISNYECNKKKANIAADIYVFNIDSLKRIIDESDKISELFSMKQLIEYYVKRGTKMHAIEHKGYFKRFSSLEDYYKHSLSFLDSKSLKELIDSEWPIHTLSHNTRPTLYGEKCVVENSMLANGCTINGTVKNSIISREVIIEEGAVVEDSVIFTETVIKKGVHVKHCVVDKYCVLENKKTVSGTVTKPLYIHQGAKI